MSEKRKTIVLTGGSRGIGHATGKRFWSAGWRVITVARRPFPKDHRLNAGPENHVQIDLANREEIDLESKKFADASMGLPLTLS